MSRSPAPSASWQPSTGLTPVCQCLFSYWKAPNWTQYSRCSLTSVQKEVVYFPGPTCYTHATTTQDAVGFHCKKALCTHCPPGPPGPFLQSCSLSSRPPAYTGARGIPAHTQEFVIAFTELHEVPDSPLFQLTGPSLHQPCPALQCTGCFPQLATGCNLLCLHSVPSPRPSIKTLNSIGLSINRWGLATNFVLLITILSANGPTNFPSILSSTYPVFIWIVWLYRYYGRPCQRPC